MERNVLKENNGDFILEDVVECCNEEDDYEDWEFISKTIDNVDEDYAGGCYTFILMRISDQKYYKLTATDLSLRNDEIDSNLEEVFRTEKTIIVYE